MQQLNLSQELNYNIINKNTTNYNKQYIQKLYNIFLLANKDDPNAKKIWQYAKCHNKVCLKINNKIKTILISDFFQQPNQYINYAQHYAQQYKDNKDKQVSKNNQTKLKSKDIKYTYQKYHNKQNNNIKKNTMSQKIFINFNIPYPKQSNFLKIPDNFPLEIANDINNIEQPLLKNIDLLDNLFQPIKIQAYLQNYDLVKAIKQNKFENFQYLDILQKHIINIFKQLKLELSNIASVLPDEIKNIELKEIPICILFSSINFIEHNKQWIENKLTTIYKNNQKINFILNALQENIKQKKNSFCITSKNIQNNKNSILQKQYISDGCFIFLNADIYIKYKKDAIKNLLVNELNNYLQIIPTIQIYKNISIKLNKNDLKLLIQKFNNKDINQNNLLNTTFQYIKTSIQSNNYIVDIITFISKYFNKKYTKFKKCFSNPKKLIKFHKKLKEEDFNSLKILYTIYYFIYYTSIKKQFLVIIKNQLNNSNNKFTQELL